jgi:hypothetical protein
MCEGSGNYSRFQQCIREPVALSLRYGECAREQGDPSETDLNPSDEYCHQGELSSHSRQLCNVFFSSCNSFFHACSGSTQQTSDPSIYIHYRYFSIFCFVFQQISIYKDPVEELCLSFTHFILYCPSFCL